VVARRLKRAVDADAPAARAAFADYWEADGRAHFREEEEILLPRMAKFASPDQPIVARVLIDHVKIRSLADELVLDPPLQTLHMLGTELERHVRREERELFPLIEQTMPEPELVQLASLLAPSARPRAH
jgi:iron-sulfur cluster repair protein YtfE (RIC family)